VGVVRPSLPLVPLALLSAGLACAAATATPAPSPAAKAPDSLARAGEARVFQLIDRVRAAAGRIRIDGRADDWAEIPSFEATRGDAGGDRSRDIVSVAIAPTDTAVNVLIRTVGPPSREDRAFWVTLDLFGHQLPDVQVGFCRRPPHVFWRFPVGREAIATTISGPKLAIGEVLEAHIPFAALDQALPPDLRRELAAAGARPWVRAFVHSWNHRTRLFVDHGRAVASYRLLATPMALDAPLYEGARAPRPVELPLGGSWYVGQGDHGAWTHQSVWGYDLYPVDQSMHPSRVRDSLRNEDFYGWHQPVRSPAVGRVVRARADAPDSPARAVNVGLPANEVWLDLGGDLSLWLGHFQQGTVSVTAGQQVERGTPLGLVGNSGQSGWPHLHLGLWRPGGVSLPLAFERVRVSLNPGGNDPWARELEVWELREGLLVERL
jgi:hypothetical protein